MSRQEHQFTFLVITCVLVLTVASPALTRLLAFPRTEFFTEMWLLGPSHKAENYPYNVSRSAEYSVYLGIGNRLGYGAYYLITVKFRNESQAGPTSIGPEGTRRPSNVSSLFDLRVFVGDTQIWEKPITFSFHYIYDEVARRVYFTNMTFNDIWLNMSGYTVAKNLTTNEFKGYLFFETWLYHNATKEFTYHERFVGLRLNMTI